MGDEDYSPELEDDNSSNSASVAGSSKSNKRNRKKVRTTWSDDMISQLISAVELRECLWNKAIKDYKSRNLKDETWRELAEILFDGKIDANELSVKWTNLRIQFNSYFAKSKLKKSGQGATEYKVSWKFYNQMLFLGVAEDEQSTLSESNFVSIY